MPKPKVLTSGKEDVQSKVREEHGMPRKMEASRHGMLGSKELGPLSAPRVRERTYGQPGVKKPVDFTWLCPSKGH